MNSPWHDIPFAPRRWPFFYGWVVVGAATLGALASLPGQTMGVGVFTDYLLAALGLSRGQLSDAYLIGTVTSGLMLPFAGSLIDRLGARVTVVIASLGLAGSIVMLSLTDRFARLPDSPLVMVMLGITVCFLAMRFFGQGCLTMCSRIMIAKWFNHRRGLAMAISGVFVAFGFSGAPVLLNAIVQAWTWRGACVAMAVMVGAGMGLLGFILYRDNPEACGLKMDGVSDPDWHDRMAKQVTPTRREFTRAEATRTFVFWVFNLGVATYSLLITAITFHITSLGAEAGLSRSQAYQIFPPMAIFSVITCLVGGRLADSVRLKWLLLAMMAAQAIGTTGMLTFGTPYGRALVIVGYGITGGLFGPLVGVAWPRFYGRRHLGAITGINMSVMVIASAIGPALFARVHALTGSYHEVLLACWFMPIAVVLATPRADNPQEAIALDDPGDQGAQPE